jgi:hypothetical protein
MDHEVLAKQDGTELWRVYANSDKGDAQTKALVDDTTAMLMAQWPLNDGPGDYKNKVPCQE